METNISNLKYEDLVKTARELFWKHGFKRVSVQEICSRSGVSKMTFYKFFSNKTELAKRVFLVEIEQGLNKFNRLIDEDMPVDEKLEKMILLKAEGTDSISQEFMQDFYLGGEPELQQFVEETTRDAWVGLLGNWKKAQQKGIFRDDLKAEFLMHMAFHMVELMRDEKLTSLYDSTQEMVLEITRFMLYGMAVRK